MSRSTFGALVTIAAMLVTGVAVGKSLSQQYGAPVSPALTADIATREALSPIAETDGFCAAISTTPANIWGSSPTRIGIGTPSPAGQTRVITVVNPDASIAICARLSRAPSDADGFTCALDTGTSGYIPPGGSLTWSIARDPTINDVPPVWVASASGTPTACIDIAY